MAEQVRRTLGRFNQRFWDAANATQAFYERRQTLITVSATLASCAAAYWTYLSRVAHQRQLEQQIAAIHANLEKSHKVQPTPPPKVNGRLDYLLPVAIGTFVLGYGAGFRHGRSPKGTGGTWPEFGSVTTWTAPGGWRTSKAPPRDPSP